MFKTIVVPTDGSPLSVRAIPYALRLASGAKARVVLVRAYLPSDDRLALPVKHPDLASLERHEMERLYAHDEFQGLVNRLSKSGTVIQPYFVEGDTADVIFNTASEEQANLIVMSTHGRGVFGRCIYGSVADEVILRVPLPVLIISGVCLGGWEEKRTHRILVPLDGSHLATLVLQPAAALAESLGSAEITLLAIVEPLARVYPEPEAQVASDPIREREQADEYLQTIASELRSAIPYPVTYRVEYGDAALTIASVAREAHVDAIAIATHGRGGAARLVLGSVASRTLQLSSVPVLVYRPVILRETVLDRAVATSIRSASS